MAPAGIHCLMKGLGVIPNYLGYCSALRAIYLITPSSFPIFVNAAIALSRCSTSCPADI